MTSEEALLKTKGYLTNLLPSEDYDEMEEIIKALEPKTGHWIGRKKVGFGLWKDFTVLVNLKGCVTDSVECSECGNWLTGSDEYMCDARYCPNCGVKMESEETV